MFGQKQRQPGAPVPTASGSSRSETVIGANTRIVGTINSDNNMRIDGAVEGDIEVIGNLIVGETGRVIATIKAKTSTSPGQSRVRLLPLRSSKSPQRAKSGATLLPPPCRLSRVGCSVGKAPCLARLMSRCCLKAPARANSKPHSSEETCTIWISVHPISSEPS